jgi:hypothetical protein
MSCWDDKWFAVMVLPIHSSFLRFRIAGSAANIRGTLPDYFRRELGLITWAEGFEDGGPRTVERHYLVMSLENG